jgi:hypothetical protein
MMELAAVANILCASSTYPSVYLRAIKLFELQVSIFAPEAEELQLDARVLAAIRILEYIERSLPDAADGVPLADLLKIPEYAQVVSILFQSGGWTRIRRLWNAKYFDEQLAIRRAEARVVARLADFSYRFAMLMPKDPRKAGPTQARECLNEVSQNKGGYSTGTLKSRWAEYGSAAALQYVLLVQKIGPKLLKLNKVNFVDRLVAQASDVGNLKSFFAAYRDVSKVLRPRGYDSPPLALDVLNEVHPELPVRQFSEKMREAIRNYKA